VPGLSAARALLYANTLRHLRLRQWVFQPIRRLQRHLPARAGGTEPVSAAGLRALREAVRDWPPAGDGDAVARARAVVAGRFRFLNEERQFDVVDWRARQVSHLWSYQLHGFAYARDLAEAHAGTGEAAFADTFARLASGWVQQTADGRGDGWEPYPISVRVVHWAHALARFGDALDPAVQAALLASLHRQLAFLARRLEWHILANHLQKNLSALYVGALLFEGPRAARWRRVAREGLWRELLEQVLPDGGHYERSPMYHALALQDFLEAMSAAVAVGDEVPAAVRERLFHMLGAMRVLARADGSLHLFNDAAEGVAPSRTALERLGRRLLPPERRAARGPGSLPDTGYFVHEAEGGDRLIVDCGVPGPAYQPGHGHCDLLSFELDAGGRPLVVDSGVHGYDGDPFREYVRSTRAHNTVRIAGREQSEVWGTFRMARRALVEGGRGWVELGTGEFRFEGAYRPFHARDARHRREVTFVAGALRVSDVVDGARGAVLESFVHFHPDVRVVQGPSGIVASAGALHVTVEPFGVDAVALVRGSRDPVQGWYCPEFGKAIEQSVLVLRVRANEGLPFGYRIRWHGAGHSTVNAR
jgi:hypothetical protein